MEIRHYQPGDEPAQVRVYNTAAGSLPGFKPANADEVARRYRAIDADPTAKFYAVEQGEVVGYAVFNPNGRISYPWCLPEASAVRAPLLDAVLSAMRRRGLPKAWAAYRADWNEPVLRFFADHGFLQAREMVNFVAELARLPLSPVPDGHSIDPLRREELPDVLALGKGVFLDETPAEVESFFWSNPYFGPEGLFGLRRDADGQLLGAALVIGAAGHADPTKIDASMPCFRLGAFGTERERHKRVNGMFSCVFHAETAGEILLAEAARRLGSAGLTHVAAQVPSDRAELIAFHDRVFQRQGAFPIMVRLE